MEVESVKREKEMNEIEIIIGASIFKAKEDEIREKIREFLDEFEEEEISLDDIKKMTEGIDGSLSEDIIEERKRI